LLSGWILSSVFDNNASYIIVVAGISMLCGAIAVLFVNDKNS
jgi:maltose/moltooligosaccharide transporter